MSRLDRLAAIHRDAAWHAAWEAFCNDIPMTWIAS
jgi:hypothetical protein